MFNLKDLFLPPMSIHDHVPLRRSDAGANALRRRSGTRAHWLAARARARAAPAKEERRARASLLPHTDPTNLLSTHRAPRHLMHAFNQPGSALPETWDTYLAAYAYLTRTWPTRFSGTDPEIIAAYRPGAINFVGTRSRFYLEDGLRKRVFCAACLAMISFSVSCFRLGNPSGSYVKFSCVLYLEMNELKIYDLRFGMK
jgi:hypothetical protein